MKRCTDLPHVFLPAAGALLAFSLFLGAGCDSSERGAVARRIESQSELIGGTGAIGGIGDYLLANQRIRVIIQDKGWSRGFGVFGGGIIDADIVRPGSTDNSLASGHDRFGEAFPAFLLQAFEVADLEEPDLASGTARTVPGIEVIADGSDGGPAIIRTHAATGDFLTMLAEVLDLAIPQRGLRLETDYVLYPDARHVEIIGRLRNVSFKALDLSGKSIATLLAQYVPGASLELPLGDVLLFGAANKVFAPGSVTKLDVSGAQKAVGFDLRYSIERSYKTLAGFGVSLPAISGLVVDFLATASRDVSYGFAVADSEDNFVWRNREQYARDPQTTPTPHSLLVPFLMSSFTGAFSFVPPATLAPIGDPDGKDVYEFKRYFVVGDGDVDSIREELYRIRGVGTGTFEGRIVDDGGNPEREAWIHVLDAQARPFSQARTDSEGRFRLSLEPGSYSYRVTAPARRPTPEDERALDSTAFTIVATESQYRYIRIPRPAELSVLVRDDAGRPLPAKVNVVGRYGAEWDGLDPREFLFDFSLGEDRRATDISWRKESADKAREFIEATLYTSATGRALGPVRPNRCPAPTCDTYDIYVSRGPEYELAVQRGVQLTSGQRTELSFVLHRVVDTTDYVSADMHLHTQNSIDSSTPIADQVASLAAEGVEMAVASDHNFVTDYRGTIATLGLQDFVSPVVGVELSTLEMGHFNAFPVRYDLAAPTHFPLVTACNPAAAEKANGTAFDWVECAPGQLFAGLRELGENGPENTLVQVNHPRDTILGYFNEFYLNPYTAKAERPDSLNYPSSFIVYPHNNETQQYAAQQFSLDFDALEVYNSKRTDLLHAFVLPANAPDGVVSAKQDVCDSGHPDNGPGKVLLQAGGYPTWPGGVDDWMHLLNDGHVFTATGNSDSHGSSEEIGFPRTYVYVPRGEGDTPRDDRPGALTPSDLVRGLKGHRALVTNGPFLDMRVKTATEDNGTPACSSFADSSLCTEAGCEWHAQAGKCKSPTRYWNVGETVEYSASNAGREVELELILRAAPWVRVNRIVLYANGEIVDTIAVDQPAGSAIDTLYTSRHTFAADTVLVAEAYGDESLFPVVGPRDEAPADVSAVVSSIAGSLASGFGSSTDGINGPAYWGTVTPYALTNPIWLDIDASGQFDPPGNYPGPGPASTSGCPTEKAARRPVSLRPIFSAPAGERRELDVRALFANEEAAAGGPVAGGAAAAKNAWGR